jgi:molybdate transport system substrate-binding protein
MVLRILPAVVAVCLLTAAAWSGQGGGTLTIAAASDLQTVLPELTAGFERSAAVSAKVTFGSSGSFVAQIQNGAPFDVFLSADADYPRQLAKSGHVDPASVYDYATGMLVMWTRRDSRLDVMKGLPLLADAQVRRIAIANPSLAPYGRAAMAAFRTAGITDVVQKKLVYAENVSQAAQFALSGNVEVAMIGHALALGTPLRAGGRFYEVPDRMHPPIIQSAAIVAASRNKANARAFLNYLRSAEGGVTLRSFGFGVPTPPTPARP